MKAPPISINAGGVVMLAGVAIVGLVAWKLYQSRAAIGAAVNPVSDQNLAYRGVNAVGAAVSGSKDFSLGTWLYDITHPNEDERLGLGPTARTPYYESGGRTASTGSGSAADDVIDYGATFPYP